MDCKALILSLVMGGFCLNASAQKVVFDFGGKVTDPSGKGISGVVVNDGIHFTKTDAQGAWSLVSDTTLSKFVSISVPASCVLPQQDGLANNYYISVRALAQTGGKHDFVLEKRDQTEESFHYIAISDPQVRNADQMKRWRQETVPDLKEVIDSLKQSREVVAMTLGDLVWDNMPLFDEYRESVKTPVRFSSNVSVIMISTSNTKTFIIWRKARPCMAKWCTDAISVLPTIRLI